MSATPWGPTRRETRGQSPAPGSHIAAMHPQAEPRPREAIRGHYSLQQAKSRTTFPLSIMQAFAVLWAA